jgi:predicted esterase
VPIPLQPRHVLGTAAVRPWLAGVVLVACALSRGHTASAGESGGATPAATESKPWCAPEVSELSDHVCFSDGGAPADGRRTLVVYLHGLLATTPGFQWLQQRAMAFHAKRLGFTVLLPTSPKADGAYVWPTSLAAREQQEEAIVAGIQKARADLEQRLGHGFDEAFVVGFSSGAYYASSLAVRGVLDVDGYIVLAGGASSAVRADRATTKRAPVFVGISAADSQTAGHSRAFAAALANMGWPYRAEERNAGHMVDWAFMSHGIQWLRARVAPRSSP